MVHISRAGRKENFAESCLRYFMNAIFIIWPLQFKRWRSKTEVVMVDGGSRSYCNRPLHHD